MKIRIAVLVSGNGTNLQALLDAQDRGEIPDGQIVLAVSNNPGAYALERAGAAGVAAVVCRRIAGEPADGFEERLIVLMREHGIGLCVLAGFMCILSPRFINEFRGRIINVHPSLIPSFCGKGFYGLQVHEEALRYGVKVTGATVHYVNEIPDGGTIIAQKAVEVLEGDTPQMLQQRVMRQAEWILLPQSVQAICEKLKKEYQP
jgi:phosphoribosylglycinamide formyltransferase 1